MRLHGAVIMIGSLFWETKENSIQLKLSKDLAEKRNRWREEVLNMDESKLITLPIRYGRKSSSRYCTYTMVFSNSVEQSGQAYCVPYKNPINVEDNFNQIYCQALELAKVEGISKPDENKLVKKWGSIGLKLNPKFKEKNNDLATRLIEYWGSYFKKLNRDLYSLNEVEKHSITAGGLLNFDIDQEMDGIDYFLATPVSPNINAYPNAEEIAKAMNDTREQYYSYFIENFNNNIRTKDDEEIIEFLPKKIKALLKRSTDV